MGERLRRVHVRWLTALVAVPVLAMGLVASQPSGAVTAPAGPLPLDLARPRILGAGADLTAIAARLSREPYRTIFLRLASTARGWNAVALDDHTIASERIKAKATKDNAFQYAINRTEVAGEPAPFPTAGGAPGRRRRGPRRPAEHVHAQPARVPAPLGGDDRDINTSEELLQYATAYDTLKGAGYPFTPADEATIRTRITDLASEFYNNYFHPESAGGLANTSAEQPPIEVGGGARNVAALALLESSPPQGPPPDDIRAPAAWLNFAIDQIDVVEGWTFTAPDGAYGEGPYYERYAAQNLLPFARAWNHAEPRPVVGRRRPADPRPLDQPRVPPHPPVAARHDPAERRARADRRRQHRLLVLLRRRADRPRRRRGVRVAVGQRARRRTTPRAASTSRPTR